MEGPPPYCDLAIIYHKNDIKTLPKFRDGAIGELVKMYVIALFPPYR
ncbi:hypothetical protein ACZ87_01028 [Candidatus Erwinia dacicola]|uniref:Uncharacterized protein n=1 Tax=Candidatus Erwinia dacicola TaxID=252393 RepID=A0A328TTM1_9GAMM|nr:hypothetical protein ACZ87_01028 [Candidatus Erwinia dacicola]